MIGNGRPRLPGARRLAIASALPSAPLSGPSAVLALDHLDGHCRQAYQFARDLDRTSQLSGLSAAMRKWLRLARDSILAIEESLALQKVSLEQSLQAARANPRMNGRIVAASRRQAHEA